MQIELFVQDGALRYRPRGLMPSDLLVRLKRHKAEVVAALQDGDGYTGQLLDLFEGEVVESTESCPQDQPVAVPGTPPVRACNGCKSRRFHKVGTGPEWVCDKCHPGPGTAGWIATWVAPEPSIHESMNRRQEQVERRDIRGLGKKGRRPTSWNGGQR